MKKLLIGLFVAAGILALASVSRADEYYGVSRSTTSGTAKLHVSGSVKVAASSTTASTYTFVADGYGIATPPSYITISSNTTITPTSGFICLSSTGSSLILSGKPMIAAGANDGQFLIVTSTTALTFAFGDDGSVTGSTLELGAASRSVTALKALYLVWSKALSKWIEIAYGNN